ncbi:hypothetical protein HanRHA438_Chr15g0730521 [Helianthus annuus]|nr:hypothetical protein HanRHA438_Chr15g0730521 [Helianthus annuus]
MKPTGTPYVHRCTNPNRNPAPTRSLPLFILLPEIQDKTQLISDGHKENKTKDGVYLSDLTGKE